jgi:hypothetical protein
MAGGYTPQAPQGGGQVNPWLMAAQQGLSGAAEYWGNEQQRRQDRWAFGQRKDLYDLIRWKRLGKEGPVISPQMIQQMVANWRQAMQPGFADMSWGASRGAGLSSPQSHRMYAQQRTPVEGGFIQGLMQQNVGLTQRRDENYLRLLAQLSRGG